MSEHFTNKLHSQESEYPRFPVLFDQTVEEIVRDDVYVNLGPIFIGDRWIAVDDDPYVVLRMYSGHSEEDRDSFILEVRQLASKNEAYEFVHAYYANILGITNSLLLKAANSVSGHHNGEDK